MSKYVFAGIIYFFSYIGNKIYNREKVEVIVNGNIVIHIYCCLSRIEKLSWTFMIMHACNFRSREVKKVEEEHVFRISLFYTTNSQLNNNFKTIDKLSWNNVVLFFCFYPHCRHMRARDLLFLFSQIQVLIITQELPKSIQIHKMPFNLSFPY